MKTKVFQVIALGSITSFHLYYVYWLNKINDKIKNVYKKNY